VSREVIAFTAHFYGVSPLHVELWKTSEIMEWYNEAAKIETQNWKALTNGGEKS
jgi:hypothetical protein